MATVTVSDSELDTLADLNRDYIQSVQHSDVRRFEEILADDFLCSNPDGSLVDRDAFLEQTAKPVAITNHGPSIDDVEHYVLLRSFASLDQLDEQERAFYEGDEWRAGPREGILELIETYHTVVLRTTSEAVRTLAESLTGSAFSEGGTRSRRRSRTRRGSVLEGGKAARGGRDSNPRPPA
jgi:hypothetical protein